MTVEIQVYSRPRKVRLLMFDSVSYILIAESDAELVSDITRHLDELTVPFLVADSPCDVFQFVNNEVIGLFILSENWQNDEASLVSDKLMSAPNTARTPIVLLSDNPTDQVSDPSECCVYRLGRRHLTWERLFPVVQELFAWTTESEVWEIRRE